MSAHATIGEITTALQAVSIPYMLTGSFASSYYGVPRSTQDIDLVIDADQQQVRQFVSSLDSSEYYAEMEAASAALRNRSMFNVIDIRTGWKIDLIFRKLRAFSQEEFRRRILVEIQGQMLHVATVEDVILAKLEWSKIGQSQRQLTDATAVLRARAATIDRDYVERWAKDLGVTDEWLTALRLAGL